MSPLVFKKKNRQDIVNEEDIFKRTFSSFGVLCSISGLILSGLLIAFYYAELNTHTLELKRNELYSVELQKIGAENELSAIIGDIHFLAKQNELAEMLDGDAAAEKELEEELIIYAQSKGLFDQIRFINALGRERVRINYNKYKAIAANTKILQNKSGRYYFKETMALPKNEIFISKLDLNMERGEIEKPYKPMLRIGTPVFDSNGNKKGILILNYMASRMFQRIAGTGGTQTDRKVLLNPEGYWLLSPNKKDEFGFMFESKREVTFAKRYPKIWQYIVTALKGQIESSNGIFTFDSIYPSKVVNNLASAGGNNTICNKTGEAFWIILSHVPSKVLEKFSNNLQTKIFALGAVLFLLIAVGSWALALAMTKRDIYSAKIFSMAMQDPLTKLPNRAMFFDRLDAGLALAARYERKAGVLYIDLDGFKEINDAFGHEAGDELLIMVARRLEQCVRKSDTVARLGGDEFAVLLNEINEVNGISIVGSEIVKALCSPFNLSSGTVTIGASVGGAVYPLHATSTEKLIKLADQAMYEVKNSGKNSFKMV